MSTHQYTFKNVGLKPCHQYACLHYLWRKCETCLLQWLRNSFQDYFKILHRKHCQTDFSILIMQFIGNLPFLTLTDNSVPSSLSQSTDVRCWSKILHHLFHLILYSRMFSCNLKLMRSSATRKELLQPLLHPSSQGIDEISRGSMSVSQQSLATEFSSNEEPTTSRAELHESTEADSSLMQAFTKALFVILRPIAQVTCFTFIINMLFSVIIKLATARFTLPFTPLTLQDDCKSWK